jgi:hypothetical protein
MAESEVRTIMGTSARSLTGGALAAGCGQAAVSVSVYDFVHAGRFEQWAISLIGSSPMQSRLVVCFDSASKVLKKDEEMVMFD